MDCSTPGFPVHHWLPDFAPPHVHRVGDAIQPSHPLSSPSPPAFTLSQPSVQFSRSVLSDSLRPHELQHARPPCPSPTPGVHSNSRPSSHQSFPMSQFFASGDQSIRVSASVSVVPVNIQDWFPLEWTGWTSYTVTKIKPGADWLRSWAPYCKIQA